MLQLTDRSSLPHVAAASLSGVPPCVAICKGSTPLLPHSSGAAPPSRELIGATTGPRGVQRSCSIGSPQKPAQGAAQLRGRTTATRKAQMWGWWCYRSS